MHSVNNNLLPHQIRDFVRDMTGSVEDGSENRRFRSSRWLQKLVLRRDPFAVHELYGDVSQTT